MFLCSNKKCISSDNNDVANGSRMRIELPQDYENCEILNQKQKHITLRENTFEKEILTENFFVEFIYIICKIFLCKNEKKILLPKSPIIFQENIQKLNTILKNLFRKTVFLGFIVYRIQCENERVLNKIVKILPLKALYLCGIIQCCESATLLEIVELISGNRPAYQEKNNLLVRLRPLYRIFLESIQSAANLVKLI